MNERETMMNADVRADGQSTETIDLAAVSDPVGDTAVMPVAADDGAPTEAMPAVFGRADDSPTETMDLASAGDTVVMPVAAGDAAPTGVLPAPVASDTVVMPTQDGMDPTREMSAVEAPTEALPVEAQAPSQVEAGVASPDEPTVPIDGPTSIDGSIPDAGPMPEAAGTAIPVGAALPSDGLPSSDGVPLYATQPPVTPMPGAPGNPWIQTPGMGAAPAQPFVQVPVAAPAPLPEPQPKTGPSGPTIVFGVLTLILGVIGMFFGFGVSNSMFGLIDLLRVSPEAFVALCIGGLGVLLVVIAIVWGAAKAAHTRRASAQKDETDKSTANDQRDGASPNARSPRRDGDDTPRE